MTGSGSRTDPGADPYPQRPATPPPPPSGPVGDAYIRIADLARIDIRPGDTIIYRPETPPSDAEFDKLRAAWEQHMPGVRLVVIPPGDVVHLRDTSPPPGRAVETEPERRARGLPPRVT